MKITTLLTLIGALVLKTAVPQQSHGPAPEATATEIKLPFGDIPSLKNAFINAAPADRNDGIPVGELGTDGGDKAMILQLAQEVAAGKHGNFDSYLIAHKGKLLFESYYRKGRINLPHPQASATKSYTSLALGRAIQLGYLSMADLDKPVTSFLKDLDPTKLVEGAEKITLHKALTMRSGISLNEVQRDEFEKTPALLKGQRQVQTFLEHTAPITEASQVFAYKDDPRLVMQVIEAVVPGTAKDFIKTELLDKMGITHYVWGTDISGLPNSGSGTSMTSRDMIKWGTLALNKGKWNGEQLVPAAFVAKATSKIVDQRSAYDMPAKGVSGTTYGYFFWQADFTIGDKSFLAKSARGGSGQNIYVIEELDLVVVTTTHRSVDSSVSVTAERVIPAFIETLIPSRGKTDGAIPINPTKKVGLLDGSCGNDEWNTATKINLPGQATIYLMHDKDYFYFCASGKKEDYTVLDLYIENSETDRLHKFHLSAQMGESIFTDNEWESASGKWDLNDYAGFWVPYSGLEDAENRKGPIFEKGTHRQMQISRSKFPGNTWNIMVGLSAVSHEGEGPLNYPQHAKSDDKSTWAKFSFPESQISKDIHSSSKDNLYFGQKPPGLIPQVFAPGIVSINGRFEGAISFSPDLKEMYFGASNEDDETHIYFSKLQGNQWTPIKRVNFTRGKKKEELHPFVSPDGKTIYFTALDTAFTDEKIWYVNRLEDYWSEAIQLDSPVNDDMVFYPNQARNGDLYYFNLSQFKMYSAPNRNGEFPETREMGIEFGHHGFISPSQDYLLVTDRNKEDESRKDNDVYVYFKNQDGTWTKPINLGNTINTSFNEKSPSITPDGKYLFFGRDERDIEPGLSNIYWVDAQIIETLRPKRQSSNNQQ